MTLTHRSFYIQHEASHQCKPIPLTLHTCKVYTFSHSRVPQTLHLAAPLITTSSLVENLHALKRLISTDRREPSRMPDLRAIFPFSFSPPSLRKPRYGQVWYSLGVLNRPSFNSLSAPTPQFTSLSLPSPPKLYHRISFPLPAIP